MRKLKPGEKRVVLNFCGAADVSLHDRLAAIASKKRYDLSSYILFVLDEYHSSQPETGTSSRPAQELSETERFLSVEEVARMFSFTPYCLAQWRNKAIGPPYVKMAGRVRYRLRDINEWLAEKNQAKEYLSRELSLIERGIGSDGSSPEGPETSQSSFYPS